MDSALETLLGAAVRAPSGDNTQPWRFVVDAETRRIAVCVDETRDPSPMNSGQRMARIAVGAAIENILHTAQTNDWRVELGCAAPPAVTLLEVKDTSNGIGTIDSMVAQRVTNRRAYDQRPVPAEVLSTLIQKTGSFEGVSTHWIVQRQRISALAELIGRADAMMFGQPLVRQAFLAQIRFDENGASDVDEGLPLASLELPAFDKLGLRLLPRMPNSLIKACKVTLAFGKRARKLVDSASGLCLFTAADSAEHTDLAVGRAMQRAWLLLTSLGLAAQPMMSPMVLLNVLENGTPRLVDSFGRENLWRVQVAFQEVVPEMGHTRPAFLMRFGYAPPPSGRTGRMRIEAVIEHQTPGRLGHPLPRMA